jgi:hypothetical protein
MTARDLGVWSLFRIEKVSMSVFPLLAIDWTLEQQERKFDLAEPILSLHNTSSFLKDCA